MKIQSVIDDPTRASRYLADQLSDAECAEYEAQFIQDPDTVAEIEATARLKIGLQRLRRNGELSELIAGSGSPHPGRTWMFAMAASIAAVVIGTSLWFPRGGNSTAPVLASTAAAFKDHTGHGLSVLATAPLFRTRAERYDAVIDLPATRGAINLRVLPSTPAESARYQASLARIRDDESSERVVQISGLQPSKDDGFVDVYADSDLLTPGRYRLTLTREASSTVEGSGSGSVSSGLRDGGAGAGGTGGAGAAGGANAGGSASSGSAGAGGVGESDSFVIKVNGHH